MIFDEIFFKVLKIKWVLIKVVGAVGAVGDSPRTPEGGQVGKRWWKVVGIMGAVGIMGGVGTMRAVGGVGMVPRFVGGGSCTGCRVVGILRETRRGSDVRTARAVCGDYGKCELQRWSYKKLCQRRSR